MLLQRNWELIKAGYYEQVDRTCVSGSVGPFTDAIFSFSASSPKQNDPDPLGLKPGLTLDLPVASQPPLWELHYLIYILVVLVVET